MTVVYIDEAFALNTIMDYLLLLSSARLAGEPLHRGRMALAAALGGLYAAALFLPGWSFLGNPLCKLALGVGLPLVAFGSSKRLLRVSLVFFGVSAAFGGGVLALQLWMGAPAIPDLRTLLLSGAACYLFFTLIFRRTARHTGRELAPAVLTLGERRCALTALLDTGNTLTDPVTGKAVMVAQAEAVTSLFRAGEAPTPGELSDPVTALEGRKGEKGRWRLLPYR
ncbi:MAG: sigma-E processing peptidase SpoIIGA, partial [Oscillospiraceae bacterium]|nr:sigma-E processing peptidase SpoIIGA [Oscillospiraceae bacterium]